jgi:hypothetical protein
MRLMSPAQWIGVPIPQGFPFGLSGMLPGTEDTAMTPDERVRTTQDEVVRLLEHRSELFRQAAYQYLWSLGHRIPVGSPHDNLLRLARKEADGATP